MAYQNLKITSKEDLVAKISKILNADEDLNFLIKLAPRELVLLASRLKNSLDQENLPLKEDGRVILS